MSTGSPPVRPHSSYRHEAFLHDGDAGLVAGLVPFVRDGLDAGQPVMAALPEWQLAPLADALGPDASRVELVDMAAMGANPARIIPAWQRFLEQSCGPDRPARGIGAPIWAARSADELAECQFHEALLNVAVDPDLPLWLRCPYDTAALDPVTIAEAHHSHPIIVDTTEYTGSLTYGGAHHVRELFSASLPEPAGPVDGLSFTGEDLEDVRTVVSRHAAAAGLELERIWEAGLAVHEVAANSVRHGGGRGRLRLWHESGSVVAEVTDAGFIDDPLAGRRAPASDEVDGRGLWLANQLCDLVQVRSTDDGAVVRMTIRPATPAAPGSR